MALSKKSEKRQAKDKARKARWEKGDSPIQRAGRFLFNKESYKKTKAEWKKKREEKKTNKEGLKVGIKKGDGSPADKAGLSVKQRTTAAKKHKAFKDNRAAMQKLRKEDPAAYREKKRRQRKAANQAAFKRGVNPSDY